MSSDVANYYTRGVRFPRLIGQTHDGTRLPFGPYTMTQAVGGLVVFLSGQTTRSLWGGRGLLGDYAVLFTTVALTVVGLRFVRTSGRDPFVAGLALLSVYGQPRHGRVAGRRLRIPRPHTVRGRPVLMDAPVATASTASTASTGGEIAPTDPPAAPATSQRAPNERRATSHRAPGAKPDSSTPRPARPVLSGVGQLLAAARPPVPTQATTSTPRPATPERRPDA